ncbi:MAG TPA: hypothetical protein VHB73_05635 [Alphaproteobacteria bacterium]|nr:hypothetical protein [Alphaproteobacteria bacterium]
MAVTLEDILKKRFNRYDSLDVMRWLISGPKTVTKTEEISILSLLAYTALEADLPVEETQKAFLDAFGITKVEQLRSDDYDDAIHFIMSMQEQGEESEQRAAIA